MKLLLFTHIFPYPLNEGGKVAQFGFLEYAAKEHEVILVTENYQGLQSDVEALKKVLPPVKIMCLQVKQPVVLNDLLSRFLKITDKIQWRLKRRIKKKTKVNAKLLRMICLFIRQGPVKRK